MKKKIPFLTRAQMDAIYPGLEKMKGDYVLPQDATPAELAKHAICDNFILHLENHKFKQEQLARVLGMN
jgi:hypothetical protein